MSASDHVWTHDGPDAELYGLEPNYGCCTANFNQGTVHLRVILVVRNMPGWPKFANMLFFTTPSGDVAVGAFAPASAVLPGGHSIDMDTTFPFEDTVRVTLVAKSPIQLLLRIPGWATNVTVRRLPPASTLTTPYASTST